MNIIVCKQIKTAYEDLDNPSWDYEEYLQVFELFFNCYQKYRGVEHPHMRTETIKTIMENLPFCDSDRVYGATLDLEYEDYEVLIPQYFESRFKRCNYSMAHFMSGDIRMMRFYETLY